MLSAFLLLILGSTVLGQKTIQCNIYNKCPQPISLDIVQGLISDPVKLDVKGTTVKNINADLALIATSANEYDDPAALVAVGFFDDFYFLVVDPTHFNAGVQVKPNFNAKQANGFCETVECDGPGCPEASVSLLLEKDFPAPSESPPSPPFYRCQDVTFDITYCPNGQFPGHEGRPIQFDSSDGQTKCLDVQGGVLNNGTLVQIYDCNGSGAQRWIISNERVQLAGTNYCLDAGTDAANGNQLKIWQCASALPAQQWIYTSDHRVALEGQGFCMDVENGTPTNGNKVQTWQCTDSSTNQIWWSEIPEQ